MSTLTTIDARRVCAPCKFCGKPPGNFGLLLELASMIKLPRSLYYHAANHTRRIQTQLGAFALCITDSKPQTSKRRTTRIRRSQRAIPSVSELDVFSSCWSQLFLKSPSQTLHDILDPGLVERILDLLERPTPGLWHRRRQHGNGA